MEDSTNKTWRSFMRELGGKEIDAYTFEFPTFRDCMAAADLARERLGRCMTFFSGGDAPYTIHGWQCV